MSAVYRFSAAWQVMEKVVRLPVSLLISIIITNYLGAAQFGQLTAAYTIVLIAVPLASLGIDAIVYKQIGNDEPTDSTISNAVVLKLLGFALVYLSFAVYGFVVADSQSDLLLTFGFILLFAAFNPIEIFLTVSGHGRAKTVIGLFAFLISTAFRLFLVWQGADLILFALAYVLETLIAAACWLIWASRNNIRFSAETLDLKSMLDVVWKAFPLLLSNIMISIFAKIDILMIAHYLGDAPVGQYAIAVNLVALIAIFPATLNNSMFPIAMAEKKTSYEAYEAAMVRVLSVSYWIGLIGALLFFFFGRSLIDFLYIDEFDKSADVLPILCWAAIFQFFGSFSTLWLVNEGLQKYRLYRITSAMVLNIVLNLIWIPTYGIQGAAYATLISYFLASILGNAMTRNTRPIFWLQIRVIFFWSVVTMAKNRARAP